MQIQRERKKERERYRKRLRQTDSHVVVVAVEMRKRAWPLNKTLKYIRSAARERTAARHKARRYAQTKVMD